MSGSVDDSRFLYEIRGSLRDYPALHLFAAPNLLGEVAGTFPVRSPDGIELDRYRVRIELPLDYPNDLPLVFETAGRVPRKADRHVCEDTGAACLLVPDNRPWVFPVGASFRQFLDVPVHDFFLSQSPDVSAVSCAHRFMRTGCEAIGCRCYNRLPNELGASFGRRSPALLVPSEIG